MSKELLIILIHPFKGFAMQQAQDVVDKFIKPWLAKHHPNADIVILAGSYGRALKQGLYQPVSSSDIDLVIIYSDLEKGGFKCAAQSFSHEDVGTALGQGPRIMMIDTNIHDLASLHYHDKVVREITHCTFINTMLDEGHVLIDRLGLAPVLQEKAAKFLAEGPEPLSQSRWRPEIDRLKTYASDISKAESIEEKRFLGTMALSHVCEYVCGMHGLWRSGGNNQDYRILHALLPEEEQRITDSFSALLRQGDSRKVEALLDNYIKRGESLFEKLPGSQEPLPFPVERHVTPQDREVIQNLFLKFMTGHLCDALETSHKRGELAWMENLSMTLHLVKRCEESRQPGLSFADGATGMRQIAHVFPDLMPVTLQAIDEDIYQPLRDIAEKSLSHMGGMKYERLDNIYAEDLARVNAVKSGTVNKRQLKLGFNL